MTQVLEQIDVCICTFQRPVLLRRLLEALQDQKGAGQGFELGVVIVDNDPGRTAEGLAEEFSTRGGLLVRYVCEPERNFAMVRNTAVGAASRDFIAFIDDDEVPPADWLQRLREMMEEHDAAGVLGPVRPYYDEGPPRWLANSRLCERPEHPSGLVLHWSQTRTGNVLLRRSLFSDDKLWFDPVYRTGGEDVDFFRRAMKAGNRFVWCKEAGVKELVPPDRQTLRYHLRRALLQGAISLKYGSGNDGFFARLLVACKCLVGILVYTVGAPVALLTGTGPCVRLLVKNCHHLGRLSAIVGAPIVRERELS